MINFKLYLIKLLIKRFKNYILVPFFILLVTSCGYNETYKSLDNELRQPKHLCSIPAIYKVQEIKENSKVIGKLSLGESGLTVGCGFQEFVQTAKMKACEKGADAIFLEDIKEPNWYASTCYRGTVSLLVCENNDCIKNSKVEKKGNSNQDNNENYEDDFNLYAVSSGSGFPVSTKHIITNNHVVEGCNNVTIFKNNNSFDSTLVSNDTINDLAILEIKNSKFNEVFSMSNDEPKLMQEIVVAGFPFGSSLSSSVKVTKGIVSSLSGLGNNFSQMQIDAAIQPGNSGGPILDKKGNVVGVAVASLDDKKIIEEFGVIPQNTNFGIKSSVIKNFLLSNNIELQNPSSEIISNQRLADSINTQTVMLNCLMTKKQIKKLQTKKVFFNNINF